MFNCLIRCDVAKSRHNSVTNISAITKKFNHVIREVNTLRLECKARSQDKVSIHITINLTKGFFQHSHLLFGFFLNNCDPITTNNLALDKDSNLIRITN